MWPKCGWNWGRLNGGKRAVVASVKGYKVDTCGV